MHILLSVHLRNHMNMSLTTKEIESLTKCSVNCQIEGKKFEEVRIPVPWGHLAGKWWGPQDKRPILCLHGWQESCGSFDPLMQMLPEQTSFLTIDYPGHGYSSQLPKGMFYHGINGPILIRRIQKYFAWPKISLLTHSMGGPMAFIFTCLYPNDVDFLFQIDGLKPFSNQPGSSIKSTAADFDNFLRYDEINNRNAPAQLFTYDEAKQMLLTGSVMFQGSITSSGSKYVLNRIIRKSVLDPSKYEFTKDIRINHDMLMRMQHDDICEYAKRVTCPMLSIKCIKASYCENKQYYLDVIEILKANNENFEFDFVDGTHHVHVNEPEKIAVIVNKFLARYDNFDRCVGTIPKEIFVNHL